MFELFLPYVLGMMMGLGPEPDNGAVQVAATETPAVVEARTPEPQVPTGKFTTAIEIKQILTMTKGNWVAVRLYEGQDLLYFTHLLSWRCGLWEVRYGINGAPATEVFPLEPCYEDTAAPNALNDMVNFLPFITLPPESVESVTVELLYDDGSSDSETYDRATVQIQ